MKITPNTIANNSRTLSRMVKFAVCLVFFVAYFNNAESVAVANNYINSATYNNMQPFMNAKMQDALRPDNSYLSPDTSVAFTRAAVASGNTPVSKFTRTANTTGSNARRVVSRSATTGATFNPNARRVVQRGNLVAARSGGVTVAQSPSGISSNNERGTSAISTGRRVTARATRGDYSTTTTRDNTDLTLNAVSSTSVGAAQCLADYRSCMDGYCKRESTPYNRCYCSAKLAEIETNLRPQVEDILRQLVIIKNGGMLSNGTSDEDLEELWQETFYQFTGTNDMASLNTALEIEWPDEDGNMRGQNAFLIGHDYCVQHLRGCFYMSSNLRDSYKSEISRDCATYETYLNNLKLAGESVISQVTE